MHHPFLVVLEILTNDNISFLNLPTCIHQGNMHWLHKTMTCGPRLRRNPKRTITSGSHRIKSDQEIKQIRKKTVLINVLACTTRTHALARLQDDRTIWWTMHSLYGPSTRIELGTFFFSFCSGWNCAGRWLRRDRNGRFFFLTITKGYTPPCTRSYVSASP